MFGLLGVLNLGEQLSAALILIITAWYVVRGKSVAGTVVGIVGTITSIILGVLIALALAIGLGWFDPQPGVFIEDVSAAVGFGIDVAGSTVWDWFVEMVP